MPINITESHKPIVEFLRAHPVGVLATVDQAGKPYAAAVYVTFDRHLNLYFVTKKDTQKSRNLEANAAAALAFYDASSQTTVQAEGTMQHVTDKKQMEKVFTDVWRIALKTSNSRTPPITHMTAGSYVVYQLTMPSLRLATFTSPDSNNYEDMFETHRTEPSL